MRRFVSLVSLLLASLPLAGPALGANPAPSFDPATYCTDQGGKVVHRTPALGTNDPSQLLVLGDGVDFCEFADGPADAMTTTRIAIDLASFAASAPTLAVLAYLTQPPVPASSTGANPASLYCAHLGGTELGGTDLRGGGWITDARGDDLDVLQVCTFADGSMIDSWGLTYHSSDVIRGADLTPLLGYQSDSPPIVFPVS